MNSELPLVVELAEPKLIAGEVDIQLSSQTFTNGRSKSLNVILGVLSDLVQDVTIDDVVA
jgi:hypothetical protein